MRNILIIDHAGYPNQNPNLCGIIEILLEKGCHVDVISRKREYITSVPPGSRLIFYKNTLIRKIIRKLIVHIVKPNVLDELLIRIFFYNYNFIKTKYDLIIGIDSYGIIKASILSRIMKSPLAMFSYEIFFENEIGKYFKCNERNACSNILFAVSQDEIRSYHLSKENAIPKDKIINIPVAGRNINKIEKSNNLHRYFKLDKNKKIALHIGNCSKWNMFDEILESVNSWPEEWILVVNATRDVNQLNVIANNKIYFTQQPVDTIGELSELILSADLGIAFYGEPTYTTYWLGKNAKYLGMASGKIATYLQHGLPVITNNIGMMSDYIREYSLGYVINQPKEIGKLLEKYEELNFRNNCILFFKNHLSLDKNIIPLLNKMNILN